MDIAQLRWFQQAADGITVTEISDLEGVSQSGVSRSLARLEAEVGVALLRRSGRVLRMTRAGAAFKHYVDRSLAALDDGFAVLSQLASPDSGTVSIAFQPSLGPWLVPGLVASFQRKSPQVRFELQQVRDDASGHVVADSSVDVEITTVRPDLPGVHWRPLLAEPLCLAVPEPAPGSQPEPAPGSEPDPGDQPKDARIDLSTYAQAPFVVLRREFVLRGICESLCHRAGFDPHIAFEGDDVSTMIGFVAAGLGVAIVPPPRSDASATSPVRYLPIDDDEAVRRIGISWSSERRLPPAAELFRAHVVDQLGRTAL